MDNLYFNKEQLKFCGDNVIIGKSVRIRNPEKVSIGSNVILDDFTYISGEVSIGDYTHIASSVTIQASSATVSIGSFVGVSSGTRIFGASSNYSACTLDLPTVSKEHSYGAIIADVIIKDYVLIGANSVVLPDANLPEGSTYAAGSVLKKGDGEAWRLLLPNGKYLPRSGKNKYLEAVGKVINICK